ncbi:Uncharacterized protein BM_BM17105 [Brugia malayi]|uniref:Uncharacterized protein n=1 Tax=Brugia malayi TaxID=6279 RepID=A0A4E9FVW1_BRUMA|nr:Uncharacterized protein BM_BM17105 [Brugia malayi]VIO99898.1 Uncharacterized protein BM_BM17105 [Brugia malayi]
MASDLFWGQMGNYWIGKDCCCFGSLSTVHFTVLAIQAAAFLLFSYLQGVKKKVIKVALIKV